MFLIRKYWLLCHRLILRVAIMLAASPTFFPAAAQVAGFQQLREHVPAAVGRLNPVGWLPATNRLQLAIGLPLRNTNELASLLDDLYSHPASPQYRHFLTPAEFTQHFGPTETDYQAVIAFARANGFTIFATHSNRLLVDVEAAVPDIEKALHVTLRTYPHPREARNFFAPDVEPSLDLATPVLHISGLDNFVLSHPLNHERSLAANPANAVPQSGSGPSGTFVAKDFRAAYVPGTTLNGAGQSVGLVQFAGYFPADILAYEQAYGLPTTTPLVNVLLDSISNITNNATGPEPALDIEMALSMATNLNSVITYYGNSTDDILNRIATDNLAKQISASWTYGIDSTSLQIFQQMAAQGQSFFNASGDSDAYPGAPSTPTDAPYITSVGGTTLTTSSGVGSWVSEKAWNWSNNNSGTNGTGGGVSTTFSMPVWQQGVSMSANLGSTTMRNLPDVAMTADNVWVKYNNGSSGDFGGTSCASPLWAGFMALVNQQATVNGYPPVGFLNPAVYAIGKNANFAVTFHDITTGNNTNAGSPTKFYAVAGYDLCTGWGTPLGTNLINALAIPDALGVTPAGGLVSTGPVDGPFSPTNWNFTLTNFGAVALNWSAASTPVWLNLSSSSGTLPAGSAATVAASVNAAATNLAAGYYPATVIFTNLNSGIFQVRQFALVVGVGLVWNSDANTNTPQDGGGTWTNQSAVNTNWWNGSGNVTWNNSSPDIATFGAGSGAAGTVTVSGGITAAGINFTAAGSGSYTIGGSGPLSLNGNINASASATISAPLTLALPGTFAVAGGQTLTVSSLIAGSSTNDLTIAGPGTVSLTAQNNTAASAGLAGSVYVNAGTLSVGSGNSAYGALGNITGIAVAAGAMLSLQSFNALSGYSGVARNVTLNGGTLTAVNGNHQVDVLTLNGGTISGSGSSTYGSINLVNNCYVTSNATISALNVTLASPVRFFYVSSNATLTVSGTLINGSGNTTSLTLNGGGTMLLTAVNTLSGGVTVNNGTLQLNPGGNGGNLSAGLLGSVSSITVNAAGTLYTLGNNAISGYSGSARNVILNGGTLTDDVGNHAIASLTLNGGTVSGAGNASNGSYNLNGNCTVTTNATISAQNFTTAAASIFNVHSNVTLAVPGTIIGSGGFILAGGGTAVMSGANLYSGNTTLSNGTLEVDGALGNSTVTVVGGRLTGTGKIAGAVAVKTGSVFSPGTNNFIGTLTISNKLSLAGTALLLLNRTNAQNCTRVIGLTTLTNGGVLTVSNLGPALQTGDSFTLFSAGTYRSNFTTLNLPALGSGLGWDATKLAPAGMLTVATLPTVTVTPANTNLECGGTLNLTAVAAGTAPLFYQWFDFQTNAILGATNASLSLTNLHVAQAGNYRIIVTNNAGSIFAVAAVGVTDTTPPMVTLNGANPLTVECHSVFTDPGATASDICAGSLSVTVSGSVNPNSPGAYSLTYSATDPSGNSNAVTRTVNVVDTTPPYVVWSFTNLVLSADSNCTATLPDVTGTNFILAADLCSDSLAISQLPTNGTVLALGTNFVVITVADNSGNTTWLTNSVVVADQTPPVISLLGFNPLTNQCHNAFLDPGAAAVDDCSGVATFTTNGLVDVTTPGIYAVSYVASDGAGNSATNTRTVYVVDTIPPVITQCVPPQTLFALTNCSAILADFTSLLTATDNCRAALNIVQSPPAGTVLPIGVTNLIFSVDDGNGNTNFCSALVTVLDQFMPVIAAQPQNVTNHLGSSVNFGVGVTACSPLNYQWFYNAAPVGGQTNSTFTLAAVGSCDAGSYQVVATNNAGSVTSSVAVLTVISDPTNLSPAGQFMVGLENDCGDLILNGGATYYWEINAANGSAGTNWDSVNAAGLLDVQASATNPFTIKMISLTAGNTAGLLADFVSSTNYSWTIATGGSGVSNFDVGNFVLDASAFSNGVAGNFSLAVQGNSLALQYVPLPQPLSVNGASVVSGGFQLTFGGPAGQSYRVLATTNLFLPLTNWPVIAAGNFSAGLTNFTDANATNYPFQFYRVVSP